MNEARKIIRSYLERGGISDNTEILDRKCGGVFVTLHKKGELRGCIGTVGGVKLKEGLKRAAIGVIHDPRFPPLELDELKEVDVEVSVLTPPVRVAEPEKEVVIGRDGIIVQKGGRSGLLLPQVPVEEGWNLGEFLAYGCLKAGLQEGCWRDPGTIIFKFAADVFREDS